jgi:hypothetical protein
MMVMVMMVLALWPFAVICMLALLPHTGVGMLHMFFVLALLTRAPVVVLMDLRVVMVAMTMVLMTGESPTCCSCFCV